MGFIISQMKFIVYELPGVLFISCIYLVLPKAFNYSIAAGITASLFTILIYLWAISLLGKIYKTPKVESKTPPEEKKEQVGKEEPKEKITNSLKSENPSKTWDENQTYRHKINTPVNIKGIWFKENEVIHVRILDNQHVEIEFKTEKNQILSTTVLRTYYINLIELKTITRF